MSEKPSALPVQEEAPTLDEARVTQVVAFLGDQRKTQSNMKFQLSNGDAEQLRLLAAALPGLLEASRLAESWKENYDAISDSLIKVKTQLSVSIRERETLTAQNAERERALKDRYDAEYETLLKLFTQQSEWLKASEAAVARLTTERDTFRDWFQNAEQARAVAESKLASRSVTRCQKCGAEALPSPTHALDLEAERDDAREDVERLTTEKAQYDADLAAAAGELLVPIPEAGTDAARMLIANRLLKSQLSEAKRVREQAIQDIEALPTFRVGKAGGLPEAVSRSAVLSIVRGSNT